MIDTIHYTLGFLVYIIYCHVTFNVYLYKNDFSKFLTLIIIYVFYSILAGYIIFTVDLSGSGLEKIIQSMIYFIAGGFYLYFNFDSRVKIKEEELVNSNRI